MSYLWVTIDDLASPHLYARLAAMTGTSLEAVEREMTGAMVGIVDGLAGRTADGEVAAQAAAVVAVAPAEAIDPERVMDEGGALRRHGDALLTMSGDPAALERRIGAQLGVRAADASRLVAMAAAVVLGALRKLARVERLDGPRLSAVLDEARREPHARLPAGFLAGEAPAGRPRDVRPGGPAARAAPRRPAARRDLTWAWWLLALLPLLVVAAWLLARGPSSGYRSGDTRAAPPTAPTRVPASVGPRGPVPKPVR